MAVKKVTDAEATKLEEIRAKFAKIQGVSLNKGASPSSDNSKKTIRSKDDPKYSQRDALAAKERELGRPLTDAEKEITIDEYWDAILPREHDDTPTGYTHATKPTQEFSTAGHVREQRNLGTDPTGEYTWNGSRPKEAGAKRGRLAENIANATSVIDGSRRFPPVEIDEDKETSPPPRRKGGAGDTEKPPAEKKNIAGMVKKAVIGVLVTVLLTAGISAGIGVVDSRREMRANTLEWETIVLEAIRADADDLRFNHGRHEITRQVEDRAMGVVRVFVATQYPDGLDMRPQTLPSNFALPEGVEVDDEDLAAYIEHFSTASAQISPFSRSVERLTSLGRDALHSHPQGGHYVSRFFECDYTVEAFQWMELAQEAHAREGRTGAGMSTPDMIDAARRIGAEYRAHNNGLPFSQLPQERQDQYIAAIKRIIMQEFNIGQDDALLDSISATRIHLRNEMRIFRNQLNRTHGVFINDVDLARIVNDVYNEHGTFHTRFDRTASDDEGRVFNTQGQGCAQTQALLTFGNQALLDEAERRLALGIEDCEPEVEQEDEVEDEVVKEVVTEEERAEIIREKVIRYRDRAVYVEVPGEERIVIVEVEVPGEERIVVVEVEVEGALQRIEVPVIEYVWRDRLVDRIVYRDRIIFVDRDSGQVIDPPPEELDRIPDIAIVDNLQPGDNIEDSFITPIQEGWLDSFREVTMRVGIAPTQAADQAFMNLAMTNGAATSASISGDRLYVTFVNGRTLPLPLTLDQIIQYDHRNPSDPEPGDAVAPEFSYDEFIEELEEDLDYQYALEDEEEEFVYEEVEEEIEEELGEEPEPGTAVANEFGL